MFSLAALLRRRSSSVSQLSQEDRALFLQQLSMCHGVADQDQGQGQDAALSHGDALKLLIEGVRSVVLKEIQESPYFSLIIDKPVKEAGGVQLPVFVRYVEDSAPKVALMGFLPFHEGRDAAGQADEFARVLAEDWQLPMSQCRGQALLRSGAPCQTVKRLSLNVLQRHPLAVVTPGESCGLAHWLLGGVPCAPLAKVLAVTEDLLLLFDESPGLQRQLAQTVDAFLNTPREALEELPETCYSKWKKREDFFDLLVDTLEGVLGCLDAFARSGAGSKSKHAKVLSSVLRGVDFVVPLVIARNACAPLRHCSTVFRCGNPADILCEAEKIPSVVELLNKMLLNVDHLHAAWFQQALQLASRLAAQQVCFSQEVGGWDSPEVYYREQVTVPLLSSLVEEVLLSFSDSHLKALSLLSLLPSCSPILAEAAEAPCSLYFSELPEPETARQDLRLWASMWRERCQEAAPPASIAETLVHPESQKHPAVSLLLRLLAVLPSVSMEWDLMKTTLGSTKLLLLQEATAAAASACAGSRLDRVLLLSHRSTLLHVPEVVESLLDVCVDGRAFFSQVSSRPAVSCSFLLQHRPTATSFCCRWPQQRARSRWRLVSGPLARPSDLSKGRSRSWTGVPYGSASWGLGSGLGGP